MATNGKREENSCCTTATLKEVRKKEERNKFGNFYVCSAHRIAARDKLIDRFYNNVAAFNDWLSQELEITYGKEIPSYYKITIPSSSARIQREEPPRTPDDGTLWRNNDAYRSQLAEKEKTMQSMLQILSQFPDASKRLEEAGLIASHYQSPTGKELTGAIAKTSLKEGPIDIMN